MGVTGEPERAAMLQWPTADGNYKVERVRSIREPPRAGRASMRAADELPCVEHARPLQSAVLLLGCDMMPAVKAAGRKKRGTQHPRLQLHQKHPAGGEEDQGERCVQTSECGGRQPPPLGRICQHELACDKEAQAGSTKELHRDD